MRRRHSVLKEVRLPFKVIRVDEDCAKEQPVMLTRTTSEMNNLQAETTETGNI